MHVLETIVIWIQFQITPPHWEAFGPQNIPRTDEGIFFQSSSSNIISLCLDSIPWIQSSIVLVVLCGLPILYVATPSSSNSASACGARSSIVERIYWSPSPSNMDGSNNIKYSIFTIECLCIYGGSLNLKSFSFTCSIMSNGSYLRGVSYFTSPWNFSLHRWSHTLSPTCNLCT